MKPNFALSLSFEGIKLLHRAAGGWREVGEVAVAAEDLAAELAMLRKTAASLEPGGVRSKLLIPASQIKYLTIETMGLSEAARRKAAENALEDATPYAVSDLVYDICMDGAKTHVAAVARETLAEAEAFATEHRFHPVSFVAVPGDAPYLGEPFFGPTKGAAALLEPDETVEPDGIAVVVVGAVTAPSVTSAKRDAASEDMTPGTAETPVTAPDEMANPAPVETKQPKLDTTPALIKSDTAKPDREAAVDEKDKVENAADEPLPSEVKAAKGTPAPTQPAPGTKSAAPKIEKPQQAGPKSPQAAPPHPADATADPTRAELLAAAVSTQVEKSAPEAKTAPSASAPPVQTPKAVAAETPPPGARIPTSFSSRRNAPGPATKPIGGVQRIAVNTPQPDSSSLVKPAPEPQSDEPETAPATPAPASASARIKTGFLSRRKPREGAAAPIAAPAVAVPATGSEAERMTVFGAREQQVGGKPRFLGLIMTVVLLVFLAGVAAWAAVFLDEGIAGLMRDDKSRATASAPENQIDPEVIRAPDGIDASQPEPVENVQIAALDPVLSAEDSAVVDALLDPRPEPQVPVISEAEAAARYAVTGIWPLAPETTLTIPETAEEPVYRSGIDPVSAASDAFALPAPQRFDTDAQLAAVVSPPPFGQTTVRDAAGLIEPTSEGVVTPEGYTLIAANPPLKPPAAALSRFAAQPEPEAVPAAIAALAAQRPKNRPLGLAERTERAQLGGITLEELVVYRPTLRPSSIQERAQQAEEAEQAAQEEQAANTAAAEEAAAQAASAAAAAALVVPQPTVAAVAPAIQSATRLATAQSRRPDTRPRNFSRIVQRAQRAAPQEETRVAASAASVAPRSVTPNIPSKTSVARSATVKNAINLRRVNLIGVYGKPSSRRALIRLGNGRYQKVKVGDRIDGGRVAAIGNSELRYTKGGRNVVLQMP